MNARRHFIKRIIIKENQKLHKKRKLKMSTQKCMPNKTPEESSAPLSSEHQYPGIVL